MVLVPLQKLPSNVGDLGKLIVAKGFKKLPKVQKIANSGHTGCVAPQRWKNSYICIDTVNRGIQTSVNVHLPILNVYFCNECYKERICKM